MSLALAPLLKERARLVVNGRFKSIRPQEDLLNLSEALVEHVPMVPGIAAASVIAVEHLALPKPGTGFLGRTDRLLCRCIQLIIHGGWLVWITWLLRPTVVVTSYSEGRRHWRRRIKVGLIVLKR